jgi:hypothetical protein
MKKVGCLYIKIDGSYIGALPKQISPEDGKIKK